MFLGFSLFCGSNLFSWGLSITMLMGLIFMKAPIFLGSEGASPWGWALTFLALINLFFASYPSMSGENLPLKQWNKVVLSALLTSLVVCFNADNSIIFYIFFELSALLIFVMVLSQGYQPERLTASFFLLLFTVFASLPFFAMLLFIQQSSGTLVFSFLGHLAISGTPNNSDLLMFFLILGFLTKFPMYFFHIWLPKAHVEASTTGSMLLAGILLKLGSYGLYRVIPLIQTSDMTYYIIFFSLLGSSLVGALCTRLTDLKLLVAYSSVAHMGLVIASLLSFSKIGDLGALAMSLSHGVSSSALFYGAGVLYSLTNSRLYLLNSGIATWAPSFSFFWFIFCCSNMGTPPTFNFWAELLMMFAIASHSNLSLLLLAWALFFAVVFNMVMYTNSQSQKETNQLSYSLSFSSKSQMIFLSHLIWLGVLTFFLDILFQESKSNS